MVSTEGAPESRRSIASIVKATSIMDAFTAQRSELSAAELSMITGIERTSIHRFLTTLTGLGLLVQSPSTRKYRLGLRVLDNAYALLDSLEIRSVAATHLVDFHSRTRRWVAVGVLDGLEVVVVERMWGEGELGWTIQLGNKLPLLESALGRCIAAALPADERRTLLTQVKESVSPGLDLAATEAELDAVAAANSERIEQTLRPNIRSTASAVFGTSGRPAGAIVTWNSAADPVDEKLADDVVALAARISHALGHRI